MTTVYTYSNAQQTESPGVVLEQNIQIETGITYASFKNETALEESLNYNTTVLRYGIFKNIEARLGWTFEEARTKISGELETDVLSGFFPLQLGAHVNLFQEKGWLPQASVFSHMYLPFFAGSDYKTPHVDADILFAFNHTLSQKSNISYNIGAQYINATDTSFAYFLLYNYMITNTLGVYAELYGEFARNTSANNLYDAGFTYLLTPNFQIDLRAGQSITSGQDFMMGFEITYLIKTKK